jgi:hypothetical protein
MTDASGRDQVIADGTADRHPRPTPPAPGADAEAYVASMQRDGRLLLRYISRRADRFLGADRSGPPRPAASTATLFLPASEVAAAPDRLGELVACVDELSWRAAPANVRTIRLSSAYLRIAIEDGEPPPDIRHEARSVRRYMMFVACLAVLLLVIAVAVLAHMDAGRRLLLQLRDLRAAEAEILKDIATLSLAESVPQAVLERRETMPGGGTAITAVWVTDLAAGLPGWPPERLQPLMDAAPLCARPLYLGLPTNAGQPDSLAFAPAIPPGEGAAYAPVLWRDPITQKASAICRRNDDSKVRMALLYSGMADWNCSSNRAFALAALPYELLHRVSAWLQGRDPAPARDSCGEPTVPLPPEVSLAAWRSHETNVTTVSSVVAGFLLPLVLGCLGGCAYALRRIDTKLSTWTLEPHDGRHAVARVALAAVLGGLVGVVWTSGETVTLGGFTLSLAAAAFFIGFSVEGVFRVIENLINNVTGSIGQPAPASPRPARPQPGPPQPGPPQPAPPRPAPPPGGGAAT